MTQAIVCTTSLVGTTTTGTTTEAYQDVGVVPTTTTRTFTWEVMDPLPDGLTHLVVGDPSSITDELVTYDPGSDQEAVDMFEFSGSTLWAPGTVLTGGESCSITHTYRGDLVLPFSAVRSPGLEYPQSGLTTIPVARWVGGTPAAQPTEVAQGRTQGSATPGYKYDSALIRPGGFSVPAYTGYFGDNTSVTPDPGYDAVTTMGWYPINSGPDWIPDYMDVIDAPTDPPWETTVNNNDPGAIVGPPEFATLVFNPVDSASYEDTITIRVSHYNGYDPIAEPLSVNYHDQVWIVRGNYVAPPGGFTRGRRLGSTVNGWVRS